MPLYIYVFDDPGLSLSNNGTALFEEEHPHHVILLANATGDDKKKFNQYFKNYKATFRDEIVLIYYAHVHHGLVKSLLDKYGLHDDIQTLPASSDPHSLFDGHFDPSPALNLFSYQDDIETVLVQYQNSGVQNLMAMNPYLERRLDSSLDARNLVEAITICRMLDFLPDLTPAEREKRLRELGTYEVGASPTNRLKYLVDLYDDDKVELDSSTHAKIDGYFERHMGISAQDLQVKSFEIFNAPDSKISTLFSIPTVSAIKEKLKSLGMDILELEVLGDNQVLAQCNDFGLGIHIVNDHKIVDELSGHAPLLEVIRYGQINLGNLDLRGVLVGMKIPTRLIAKLENFEFMGMGYFDTWRLNTLLDKLMNVESKHTLLRAFFNRAGLPDFEYLFQKLD